MITKFETVYIRRWEQIINNLFTPLDLFQSGEQGLWYDPSDLTTLFQDSAGTTPVTADGDPVGLMLDKSQGLELGEELVTNTTFDSDLSGWDLVAEGDNTYTVESGRVKVAVDVGYNATIEQEIISSISSDAYYKVTVDYETSASDIAQLGLITLTPYRNETSTLQGTSGTATWIIKGGAHSSFKVRLTNVSSAGSYVYFDNVSVKELPGNHATQSVSASRPTYRTDGTLHKLEFDGVDDKMSLPAANIFDSAGEGSILLGTLLSNTSVSVVISAPFTTGVNAIKLNATGSTVQIGTEGSRVPSDSYDINRFTRVNSGAMVSRHRVDWSTATGYVFEDGVEIGSGTVGSAGVSDSASGDIMIGAQANSAFFIAGDIYSIVIIEGAVASEDIASSEAYIADKSGVTL
jgi:hypothetical protein